MGNTPTFPITTNLRAALVIGLLASCFAVSSSCAGAKSLAPVDPEVLEIAPPDSWREAGSPGFPYRCAALKVTAVNAENAVAGYYSPVRCVRGLQDWPGSIRDDGTCVVGCQHPGPGTLIACFTADCSMSVE